VQMSSMKTPMFLEFDRFFTGGNEFQTTIPSQQKILKKPSHQTENTSDSDC